MTFAMDTAGLFGIVSIRYFLVAGGAYYLAEKSGLRERIRARRIGSELPKPSVMRREIQWSLLSSLLFAASGAWLVSGMRNGTSAVYFDVQQYGWGYYAFSIGAFLFLHETYFYWTHRLLHWGPLFKLAHRVHHDSRPPTAWAAFSFHPIEATIQAAIIPLLAFFIPIHWTALVALLTLMTLTSVTNHLGYEIYPKDVERHRLLRWWITANHHQKHHHLFRGNYGLYFTFWDRLMGTQVPDNPVHIVGGGLAGGLLAYRLDSQNIEFKLFEKSDRIGGNHTWSFHWSDIDPSDHAWLRPLVTKEWAGYDVYFPDYHRAFLPEIPGTPTYASIRSENFHEKLVSRLGSRVQLNAERSADATDGAYGIDARGALGTPPPRGSCGFQKFVGLDVELVSPHGLTRPILMDARCEQRDGFRFFYVLPWDAQSLLIEDTRYSNTPDIDPSEFESEITNYAASQGWVIKQVLRREQGALPIPVSMAFLRHASQKRMTSIGMRAGGFNLTTGYSLPQAVRASRKLAGMSAAGSHEQTSSHLSAIFFLMLNRMLFGATSPKDRYTIIQHFYRFPEPLIRRFYAGRPTLRDMLRILVHKPPVSISGAIHALINPWRNSK